MKYDEVHVSCKYSMFSGQGKDASVFVDGYLKHKLVAICLRSVSIRLNLSGSGSGSFQTSSFGFPAEETADDESRWLI